MNYIKFFGIHSNRVKKILEAEYKNRYGEDSDEYKDFKEKRDLIKSLEDSDNHYLSGYTYSPRKVVQIMVNQDPSGINSDGYYRNYNRGNPYLNKMSNKNYQDVNDKYLTDMIKHNNKLNEDAKIDSNKNKVRDVRISPYIENQVRKARGSVAHSDNHDNGFSHNNGYYGINVRSDADDSTAGHEFQHMKNYLNGNEYPFDKYNKSNDDFKYKFTESIKNPDTIQNYINNVLQEELSANRGRVMNAYLYGGKYADNKLLDRFQKHSNADQSTYNSTIGGYNAPSLRYNMDKNSIDRLIKNMKKLNKRKL